MNFELLSNASKQFPITTERRKIIANKSGLCCKCLRCKDVAKDFWRTKRATMYANKSGTIFCYMKDTLKIQNNENIKLKDLHMRKFD